MFVLLAALGVFLSGGGLSRYHSLSQGALTLRQKNQELVVENAKLRTEIESLKTDIKVVERALREELGYIRPDEMIFSFEGGP
ncbi:MAG: septum formation initiator family protein [Proteobacteria bacterium]|nr:septum formation initiator family protein [Cystobacterineae bacterium]MCL2258925.1 septum formation initiator family protein [Cystobacterineae bacterium]MCL2314751.1 septum formation initiator family protein [Pseudomonadota bacterium]